MRAYQPSSRKKVRIFACNIEISSVDITIAHSIISLWLNKVMALLVIVICCSTSILSFFPFFSCSSIRLFWVAHLFLPWENYAAVYVYYIEYAIRRRTKTTAPTQYFFFLYLYPNTQNITSKPNGAKKSSPANHYYVVWKPNHRQNS